MPRYYVTMTWDNWPEGGSYGDVVEAANDDEAAALTRRDMAESRADEYSDADDCLESYGGEWHVVDCFDLDDFVARHARQPVAAPAASNWEAVAMQSAAALRATRHCLSAWVEIADDHDRRCHDDEAIARADDALLAFSKCAAGAPDNVLLDTLRYIDDEATAAIAGEVVPPEFRGRPDDCPQGLRTPAHIKLAMIREAARTAIFATAASLAPGKQEGGA